MEKGRLRGSGHGNQTGISAALPLVIEQGVDIPLVYNCGGTEEVATLQLLDGIFDIYMPDFKYGVSETAQQLSGVPHYVETAKAALIKMHRQVGNLDLDPGVSYI